MKKLAFVSGILLFLIGLTSCSKPDVPPGTPPCIKDKINLEKDKCLDKMFKYKYKGKTVYLFTSDCPDFYQELYDKDCILICFPSGGFSGNGDGRCKDFYTEATNEEIIWQK